MILDAYPRGDVHGPWSSASAEDWCWGCHSLGRNLWSVYHLCVCLYLSVWLSNHLSSIYLIHHIFFNWLMSNSVLWSPDKKIWLTGKDSDARKDWGQEEKRAADEMVGWHHWCSGHEFEKSLKNSAGQGSLVCCSPWGHKGSDTIWQLNKEVLNVEQMLLWGLRSSLKSGMRTLKSEAFSVQE